MAHLRNSIILLALLWAVPAWGGDTYFVTKNGNDANDGKSWSNAFLTTEPIDNDGVADSTGVGDTVIFGRGFWEEVLIQPPTGGSNTNWTVYACSTWYTGTTSAEKVAGQMLTTLCGGSQVSGWVYHSGGAGDDTIWRAAWLPAHAVTIAGTLNYTAFCLTQGDSLGPTTSDSMLVMAFSLAQLDKAGEFYHNTSTDSIYVRPYGDVNPTTRTFIAASHPVVFYGTANVNHIRFWGLNATHAWAGPVQYNANNVDSTFFEHGWLKYGAVYWGGNAGSLFHSTNGSSYSDFPTFRACSTAWNIQGAPDGSSGTPPSEGWIHGGAVVSYGVEHVTIDSCAFMGFTYEGIMFKNGDDITGDPFTGHVVKYSTLTGATQNGIWFDYSNTQCSVYGCIIYNVAGAAILLDGRVDDVDEVAGYFVANNTIYNTKFFNGWRAMQASSPYYSAYKYNVNYVTTNNRWHEMDAGWEDSVTIDSNLYYDSPTSNFSGDASSSCDDNWTAWQACGFDVYGDTTNPNFDSASATSAEPWADFKRSGAPQEMEVTYGGRTWYNWGAVQNDYTVDSCPNVVVDSLINGTVLASQDDSLRMDINTDLDGNTCSLMVWYGFASDAIDSIWQDTTAFADSTADWVFSLDGLLIEDSTYWWYAIYWDADCPAETTLARYFVMDSVAVCSLVVAPASLTFNDTIGTADPASKELVISNGGDTGTVKWVATSDSTWLTYSDSADEATSVAHDTIDVSVTMSGLTEGVWYDTIMFVDTSLCAANTVYVEIEFTLVDTTTVSGTEIEGTTLEGVQIGQLFRKTEHGVSDERDAIPGVACPVGVACDTRRRTLYTCEQ